MCGQASCPYRERPAPGRFVWVDIAITLRSADSGRLGGVARYISRIWIAAGFTDLRRGF
jgi:hypothetical protein